MTAPKVVCIKVVPKKKDFERVIQEISTFQQKEREYFGKFIRRLRQEKGWSITELAEKLEVARQFIESVEKGKETLSQATGLVKRTAAVFEIDVHTLLARLPSRTLLVPEWSNRRNPLAKITLVERLKQRLSATDLGRRAKLRPSVVSAVEHGDYVPGEKIQGRLFSGLHISVSKKLLPSVRAQGRPRIDR